MPRYEFDVVMSFDDIKEGKLGRLVDDTEALPTLEGVAFERIFYDENKLKFDAVDELTAQQVKAIEAVILGEES